MLDQEAIVNSVKILLGVSEDDVSKEVLLAELVGKCVDDVCAFCNDDFDETDEVVFPKGLVSVLKDWVILQYSRIGSVGKASESMGDYSVAYEGFPVEFKQRLYAFRKMRVF